MLSRTADHLFWMSRYMERAENTARLLDVNYQTSLLPQSQSAALDGWRGLLSITELSHIYQSKHDEVTPALVTQFMVADANNPSSIFNCLRAARENARAVRGTLTTEVWETINHTWLDFTALIQADRWRQDPAELFEWVKFRSHLSRGVTYGTMLQDESYHFLRIGTHLERADNTARLLDVKFHARNTEYFGAENGADNEAKEVDFYYWSSLLRSVAAFEVYRKVYRNVIEPAKVAELLMLRSGMPRSLVFCVEEVVMNMRAVSNAQSPETLRRAGRLLADLQYAKIDEILATGLHAYLTQFLDRVNDVGIGISRDFLVPT
jgi:uncharacterized alpha-E superfamily protein